MLSRGLCIVRDLYTSLGRSYKSADRLADESGPIDEPVGALGAQSQRDSSVLERVRDFGGSWCRSGDSLGRFPTRSSFVVDFSIRQELRGRLALILTRPNHTISPVR